jgi:hypothetical protein
MLKAEAPDRKDEFEEGKGRPRLGGFFYHPSSNFTPVGRIMRQKSEILKNSLQSWELRNDM